MTKTASGILPLIALDRKSPKPLHAQIYDHYRVSIIAGRLRAEQRLPSTRLLASELGISRFSVLTAYAQLHAEGYLKGRRGSGTTVSGSLPDLFLQSKADAPHVSCASIGPRHISKQLAIPISPFKPHWVLRAGAFNVGEVAFDHFPVKLWTNLIARHAGKFNASALRYTNPMGLPALRAAVADYLRVARSVQCDVEQVMIVSGSQQGLHIASRVLVDRGSAVWVEEPGYSLARNVFARAECRLIPVPVDDAGLDVAAGIHRYRNARAAVVTPSHQFPTGVTMSVERRFELLRWARGSEAWIIEDDYDSEYRYDHSPIASLQGLDQDARVVYLGTFSKVLFPSLRLGYLVIPKDLIPHFVSLRRVMDYGPSMFFQMVLADFIMEGHFGRHLRRMRLLYQKRRAALVEAVAREFRGAARVLGSEAGIHLAMTLPCEHSDSEIAERAARKGLWLWPLSSAYMEKPVQKGFILGFGNVSDPDIRSGIASLRSLMKLA